MTSRPGTLVIGIGNTLRGDDGAGVVATLEAGRRWPDRLEVITVHQLVPELAERIRGATRVVFVDASTTASDAIVTALDPDEAPSATHTWSPRTLLGLARRAYGTAPAEAWLVEIPAGSFGFAESISAGTAAAIVRAAAIIGRLADVGE